jgi:hypothetical protein
VILFLVFPRGWNDLPLALYLSKQDLGKGSEYWPDVDKQSSAINIRRS